jgi:hypothetical protein
MRLIGHVDHGRKRSCNRHDAVGRMMIPSSGLDVLRQFVRSRDTEFQEAKGKKVVSAWLEEVFVLMIDCEKSAIFDAITKVKGSLLKISPGFERVRTDCICFDRTPEPYSIK